MKHLSINKIAVVFCAIPVVAFFVFVVRHAVNVPYNDDAALLETINAWSKSPNLGILVEQQNVHRIFFPRLGALLIFLFNGELNFRYQIIAGFFNLFLLVYAFFLVFKSLSLRFIYFTPVAFLLFSPVVYTVHIWSITAFQYTLCIAFSLLALYFIQPSKRKWWYWSILFSIFSTLSNLDGVSSFAVCLLWLLTQKRFKESALYGIFSILYLWLFFQGFKFGSSTHSSFKPLDLAMGFVCMVGSTAKILSDSKPLTTTFALGILMLLIFGIVLIKKWVQNLKDSAKFPVFTFVEISFVKLLTCLAMIAVGRGVFSDGTVKIGSRFLIYSVSISIIFYLLLLANIANSKMRNGLLVSVLLFSVGVNFVSYQKYEFEAKNHVEALMADAHNFSKHGLFLHQYLNHPDPNLGFYAHYKFPQYFSAKATDDWQRTLLDPKATDSPKIVTTQKITNRATIEESFLWDFYALEVQNIDYHKIAPKAKTIYLALIAQKTDTTTQKLYLISLQPNSQNWIQRLTGRAKFTSVSSGFPAKLPKGNYVVGLCWSNENTHEAMLLRKQMPL